MPPTPKDHTSIRANLPDQLWKDVHKAALDNDMTVQEFVAQSLEQHVKSLKAVRSC